ncbi:hypothetical protein HNR73_007132 [Phytomonospora endophytica]|uniref:Uncharacterized protein n=1 Tax=Phytomonospora endophytica TaxID=714109 RepID=A0A841FPK5_9ACTN|nr:hypothetical protein [Phytomonospora endophytica]
MLGAILSFAVEWELSWLNLQAAGLILMAAGALWLVIFFRVWNKRRAAQRQRRTIIEERHVPRTVIDEEHVPRTVVEERHVARGDYDDRQAEPPARERRRVIRRGERA